ncbi:MAG TPA: 1,4-dihydroxy-2-naphthoate polyprenyltransferase [Balneolaceae bacterium]|nr:1,4-dihydroxy-2-naphthoate polyprenyltransferase [Balneolaceae bacterium]
MISEKKFKIWVQAARPQTLPAAFVPVLVGSSLAARYDQINWPVTGMALLCAFLIQIGTNFANDYFDYVKGADTDERIGFERATATGQIDDQQMLAATLITMSLAFICGLYIVWNTSWVVLAIGIFCIVCGILYTGGPYPLGYHGLGDIFVFVFFGIIAVTTTYYINVLHWSMTSFWASVAVGALAIDILVVNNLRDIEQDRPAGKNTLGVLFGEDVLRWEYVIMLLIAFAIPLYFFAGLQYNGLIFLPFLSLPFAGLLIKKIWTAPKHKLDDTLKRTGIFMTVFCILFSVGILTA